MQQDPPEPTGTATQQGQEKGTMEAQKEVAYYAALVGAWINTRMEFDKALVTISSAGIALLVTLATVVGASTGFEFLVFILAVIGFLATILCTLFVYHQNSRVIEAAIKEGTSHGPDLRRLDLVKLVTFVVALTLTATLILFTAARKL